MKKQEDIIIGNRIRKIRTSLQMDQKQFSEIINTTVSALSNWENGRNKPNMEKLKRIAQLADISVEELLYGNILKHYFNEHWTQLIKNEDTSKAYYEINQKEFEYVQSSKEKIYDIFYNNALEYGYSDNNNDNFYLFALAIHSLLTQYYTVKENDSHARATILKAVSKTLKQIALTAVNAGKQTPNIDDKMFYLKLVEITEDYVMQINQLFEHIRTKNNEDTL